ncbi:MAG: hypothetical protein ACI8TV_001057 [Porticoccaceae bacterium]|jgi:hypothetical protein|nr:DUF1638 domain-containing protein [SAR92 clade bacterium]MDB9977849.1 DUF1638 domain-containing protein [Porticoccaceae bacterium]|tara:strand:+ start:2008 stop:2628 length:621 start_codon:yes stop_codon:yes gene_type:complete
MKRVSEQSKAKLLVIACGALAHEIVWLQRLNNWNQIELQCLDAELHNRPKLIPQKLRDKIQENLGQYQSIFVAYADCGTGGEIDRVLEEENIERLPGAHCYSFYATEERFSELAEQELGTFYLTDFLVEHFDRIMIKGLKLDRHPELRDQYFANYTRVIYLSQRQDAELVNKAKVAAEFLGLGFRHLHTGYGDLDSSLQQQILKFS